MLHIGLINPTSVYGKTDLFAALGEGIWGMSETSATRRAQSIVSGQMRKMNRYVQFNQPVRPHKKGVSALRGHASGCGVFSDLRVWKSVMAFPVEVERTARILQCFVQVSPNLVVQTIVLYGAHHTSCESPLALLDKLMRFALDRASSFKGPTIIMGDLNAPLEKVPTWKLMQECGFFDAAFEAASRQGVEPSPTCRDATRYMFILCSSAFRPNLVDCDTLPDYLFDSHPALRASFSLKPLKQAVARLSYPQSLDAEFFDYAWLEHEASCKQEALDAKVLQCLEHDDPDSAARVWTQASENLLCNALCDATGHKKTACANQRGRASLVYACADPPAIPCCRKARDSDFEPSGQWHNVRLRQRLRQVRRVQSLCRQVQAWEKSPSAIKSFKCHELWKCILQSTGFKGGFGKFLFDEGFPYVPTECPDSGFLTELFDFVNADFKAEEQRWLSLVQRKRKQDVRDDMQRGGRLAFNVLRDEQPVMPNAFQVVKSFRLLPQRLTIGGSQWVRLSNSNALDSSRPVHYRGLSYRILEVQDKAVKLDRPLVVNAGSSAVTQVSEIVGGEHMAKHAQAVWDTFWKRDVDDGVEDGELHMLSQQILDAVPA